MTLFPLVGIDYALGLSAKFDGNDVFANSDYSAVDMSQLWIRFGVGTDIALNEKMFLRPVVQYGIGFAIGDDAVTGGDDANIDHGLTVKVGLGFRF
jgi:serine acetyltransferase